MKDEFNGVKIIEFVGLKSKMYSLISVDDREVNKGKGINKKLRHQEYVDVLFNKKVVRHSKYKVNYMRLIFMMFLRFHKVVLMIKEMYLMMG